MSAQTGRRSRRRRRKGKKNKKEAPQMIWIQNHTQLLRLGLWWTHTQAWMHTEASARVRAADSSGRTARRIGRNESHPSSPPAWPEPLRPHPPPDVTEEDVLCGQRLETGERGKGLRLGCAVWFRFVRPAGIRLLKENFPIWSPHLSHLFSLVQP